MTNQITVTRESLALVHDGVVATLGLRRWDGDRWRPVVVVQRNDRFVAEEQGIRCQLHLTGENGGYRYKLSFESERPTRLQLRLEVAQARNPFHAIPGGIFGDHNLGPCEPKRLAHLTTSRPDAIDCSPYWEFRADRASHPVSVVLDNGLRSEERRVGKE